VDAHLLDRAVASLSRRSHMFARGWGDEVVLAECTRRDRYLTPPRAITLQWDSERLDRRVIGREGSFLSPVDELPAAVRTAYVRSLSRDGNAAACVLLAASRDEGYGVRERVFGPLTERGVNLYILENPFYGRRRNGRGPSDITVAEHCLMCLGTVSEARALLTWLQPRYAKLAVAGYSMGGHMAALAAAVTPFPVACAALATGGSASAIYTRGMLSWSVDFDALGGNDGKERLRSLFEGADITKFRPPIRVSAAVISGCVRDGYVLASETERLHRHWKGSALRWVEAGHFSALLTQRQALLGCVQEAVEKL
jgi:alpha/beta hydrolase family protein